MPRLEWWVILSTIQVPWGTIIDIPPLHSFRTWHLSLLWVGFTPKPVKGRVWICFPSVTKDEEVEIQMDKVFT